MTGLAPKLRPYPVHRDAGMEWLGTVPDHREASPVKSIFREKDSRRHDGRETHHMHS